jgi:hypothetical protein
MKRCGSRIFHPIVYSFLSKTKTETKNKDFQMSSTASRTRNSVQAGACFDATSHNCALEATACRHPASFVSSRELQSVANAHGGHCLKSDSVGAIAIGRCLGDGGDAYCASDEALCLSGLTFLAPLADDPDALPGCKVRQEGSAGQGLPTSYGRCGQVDCVWSSSDCGETFLLDPTCTCEKVIVGACEREGQIFCSVSPQACDEESQWMSPQQLQQQTDHDCYLCREYGDPSGFEETTPSTSNVTSSGNLKKNALIGGLVGVFLGLALMFAVFVVVRSRRNVGKKGIAEQNNNPPPSEVDVSCQDMSEIGDEEDLHEHEHKQV